jgi:hypothetical protein
MVGGRRAHVASVGRSVQFARKEVVMSTDAKKPADRKQQSSAGKFKRKVLSITGGKLVMVNKKEKEYSHPLADDHEGGNRNVATCIEAPISRPVSNEGSR